MKHAEHARQASDVKRPVLLTLAAAAMLIAWILPPADASANGELTYLGCLGDNELGVPAAEHECDTGPLATAGYEALDGAGPIAFSPDGEWAYITAYSDDAVVWAKREADGTLTPAGCIANPPAADGCTAADGLNGAWGLVVSEDGENVYVAGIDDDAVTSFEIQPNGSLTYEGCVEDVGGSIGCAAEAEGLAGAYWPAMGPDGNEVYVAAQSDGALVELNRAADGSLSFGSCYMLGAVSPCVETPGLQDAYQPIASSDGKYVDVGTGTSVASFMRNANGTLSSPTCVTDPDEGTTGCEEVAAVDDPYGLGGTSDGETVFVPANGSSAITALERQPDGSLDFGSCVQDTEVMPGNLVCGAQTDGLHEVAWASTDPFEQQLVTGSIGDHAVNVFDLSESGGMTMRESLAAPTASSCVADADDSSADCPLVEGLTELYAVAISPDGTGLYASGYGDSAIAMFDRALDLTSEITGLDPASPSGETTVAVSGSVFTPAGSVTIYGSDDCSGAPLGSGTYTEFVGAGIDVTVPENSTTPLTAMQEQAGQTGACSAPVSYEHSKALSDECADAKAALKKAKKKLKKQKSKLKLLKKKGASKKKIKAAKKKVKKAKKKVKKAKKAKKKAC